MFIKKWLNELVYLLSFMGARKKKYIFGMLGDGFIQAGIVIVLPFVFKDLTDFASGKDTTLLIRAVIMVSGTLLLVSILSPTFSYIYRRTVKEVMADVRLMLFKQVGRFPSRYYEQHHSGDIMSRLSNDLLTMERTYSEHVKTIAIVLFSLVGSLIGMFLLDWRFASVLVVLSGVTLYINTRFAKSVRKISDKTQQQQGVLTERLNDFLAGLPIVKMFHLHRVVTRRYTEMNGQVTASTIEQGHKNALLEGTNFFINFLSFGGMLVFGIIMVAQDVIGVGSLVAIIQQQLLVTLGFLHLGQVLSILQSSLSGASRVIELLQEPIEPERYSALSEELPYQKDKVLEMNQVVFEYDPDSKVLDHFSFSIEEGETAALVGASGSGKSTVIKLLLGYYPAKSGDIRLFGKTIGEYTLQEMRNLISYVPQDAYLFEGTIEENIRYGKLDATHEEIVEATRAAYAHDFIMDLPDGYETRVGERGALLSGGQRQRIAIARAIVKNAPVLLLDEATSALDSGSEYWVQRALAELMKDRTTLIVAHRLSTVEDADMIYVVDQGNVVEHGHHEELLKQNGFYTRLYKMQTSLSEEYEYKASTV
ncbi:ABC transporter ATP-binding protein [Brevibacillus laterosporus]|uniref:ABC transporter ATP-binding protein n=2 Tax=Brevibacillus laterosporus TaxID=1465 RepID=A0AAP3GC13_BRELA|nr:ABC transporter ATP-binding protein [Brevibacillus laterosporus]MCR8981812.1 ABC transporter ATP-binding protein/permease [Brevibacillus laterosporus]MCZ0808967.1 ABC transporter ATP-binding protein [Brevibacillus laterosporus]MCZ0827405.1 ABC transporter ATP-binding protein [Brevibacillus laterosporus]MCZ0852017.1 ABC transporter ATP-binding protein [Brevibacillus laterosporus]